MEKSIENIWKEGFLKNEALVAPQVNNLYTKKSQHLIDRFKRTFDLNIRCIMGASFALLVASYFVGALIAGLLLFLMMSYVAYTAHSELKALEKIDKGENSFSYLQTFKAWIENSIERYGRMYRVVYPGLILIFYFGLWFSNTLSSLRLKVSESSDDLIFGMHLYTTLFILAFALIMSIFSKAIHRKDVQLIYGGIIRKLDDALADMKDLSQEQ
ncbi:MAG: hypothetical protein DA405_10190 [Bacteroidetes bacterium]|nr:MAG: hypothetical protein DA405_10190 [Bacteroidota bacterium]